MEAMNQINPEREEIHPGRVSWGTLALAGVLLALVTYFVTFQIQLGLKTPAAVAGIVILSIVFLLNVASIVITLRQMPELGIKLTFYSLLVLGVTINAVLQGRALTSSLSIFAVSVTVIEWLFPRKTRRKYLAITVAAVILIWVFEWINPPWRAQSEVLRVGPFAALVFGLLIAVPFLRQGWQTRLRDKMLIPSMSMVFALVLGLAYLTATQTQQRNEADAVEDLTRTAATINASIKNLEELALGMATQMANSPQVQAAFAAGDRELLQEITLPTFLILQEKFEVKQFQFILPPATSFLRLHQLNQFGDDLSGFRFTALEANATKSPVSGIEIGRGGLGVRGEVPVSFEGRHIGVIDVGLDIGPQYLETLKEQYGVDIQILLEKGAAETATFEGVTSDVSGPTPNLLLQASTFDQSIYADPSVYAQALNGESPISQLSFGGKSYSIINVPLKDYSGKTIGVLGIFDDRTEIVTQQTRDLLVNNSIILAASVIGGLILLQLINFALRPINTLTQTATALAGGDLERRAQVNSRDELGILADAFNNMTDRLRDLISTLEQRVAARTRNLVLAAEVGRAVSQVRALDAMLKDACELILKEFNLYYVQVYLTDPANSNLILEAGTGSVGVQLLGRRHSLPLNINSINGRSAVEKHPIVIPDTTKSASFLPNALLPETRGEMAIPLIISNRVVGVLDMQSSQPNVLTEEVLPAFEALAGQMAVAVQNATLLAETEQARAQVEMQARRLIREGWREYLDAIHTPEQIGYVFDNNQVLPLTEAEGHQLTDTASAVSVPISVTGEPLGALVVELSEESNQKQVAEIIHIVAKQVAQQVENLRLLESAERYRAESEEATRRLTREGWAEYFEQTNANLSFLYDQNEVRPLSNPLIEDMDVSIPLTIRNEPIGRMSIQGISTNDKETLEFANIVAQRLGTHIESLRLSAQTEQALNESQSLYEIGQRLAAATNEAEILMAIAAPAMAANCAVGELFYIEEKDGQPDLVTTIANWYREGSPLLPVGTSYSFASIPSSKLLLSSPNAPIFISDTQSDERADDFLRALWRSTSTNSTVIIPLHSGGQWLGMAAFSWKDKRAFSKQEQNIYAAIASLATPSIQSRRQFERAQQQAQRESMLNTINQKIQSATSVEAVLQIAARELGHALGAPMTIAQLSLKDTTPSS